MCCHVAKVFSCQYRHTIIFLRQARLAQSWGRKRLWAPLLGSTRNSPMGTVPEHHSNTPLRCEKGTTWNQVYDRFFFKQRREKEMKANVKQCHRCASIGEPCIVWCWASSCECLYCAAAAWSTCRRPAASLHPVAGRPDPVYIKTLKSLTGEVTKIITTILYFSAVQCICTAQHHVWGLKLLHSHWSKTRTDRLSSVGHWEF